MADKTTYKTKEDKDAEGYKIFLNAYNSIPVDEDVSAHQKMYILFKTLCKVFQTVEVDMPDSFIFTQILKMYDHMNLQKQGEN